MNRRWPPATLLLGGAIVAAWLGFLMVSPGMQDELFYRFAVIPARFAATGADRFTHWWEALGPLFGHAFLHGGWLHLGMNMLVFLQASPIVENRMGSARYLLLFAISAAAGALAYVLINPGAVMPAVGASGAICGLFAAYFLAFTRDWRAALAEPRIRNAAGMFLFVNVGLAAVARMTGFIPIAWEAHLGGFIGGAVAFPLLAPKLRIGPWDRPTSA